LKWLGQNIVDFLTRFKNSVYFENVENGATDTDKFLIIGSSGKLKYRTGAEVFSDIGAGDGDITSVRITTDSGAGSPATVSSGAAAFTLVGTSGVGVTNSDLEITVTSVPGEIDHDSLLNFAENEHFTQANITTVGTIGTGVWQGTKITDIYTNSSGKRYGNTIKILPQDFMKNDDSSGNALNYKDGANSGIQVDNASLEAMVFVAIPEGMKATHVDIFCSSNVDVVVIEEDITASIAWTGGGAATDLAGGSGAANTQITLSSAVDATADNMLGIKISLTATNQRIYGGKVTIAPQ
jgi:hypothetical protein